MKGIRLLLKNAFRTAWRSPSQLFGLSSLVMLVSMIISLLFATSSRVVDAYDDLNIKSNIRDAILDIDSSTTRLQKPKDYGLKDIESQEAYQQWVLNNLAKEYNFYWSRTEGRTFSEIKLEQESLILKVLAKVNQDKNNGVDRVHVSQGQNLSEDPKFSKRQIIVGESFALKNNIEIGDIIRVQKDKFGDQLKVRTNYEVDSKMQNWNSFYEIENSEFVGFNWFKVIGFASSADFVTPIIDSTSVLPNVAKEAIMYVDPHLFGLYKYMGENYEDTLYTFDNRKSLLVVTSDSDKETYYSLKSNEDFEEETIEELNEKFKEQSGINKKVNFFYKNNDSSYRFYERIATFKIVLEAYNLTTIALLIIILSISAFTIILITRKQIDNMRKQIGCLKSLGYHKREIVYNFIAAPLIVAVIGSILGYILSVFISGFIVTVFSQYFNIAFIGFTFNILSFLASLLFIWFVLTFTATAMAYYTIKDSALTLLKGNADSGISRFGLLVKTSFSRNSFNSRLRAALLTTTLGKLIGVSLTMFLGTFMLSTTIIAPKVLKDNKVATFSGLKFENQVEYTQPISSNPLTFYKTYNPNFKNNDWGFSEDKYAETYAGKNKVVAKVASPVTKDGQIDVEKILNQLIEGNIDSKFYDFDIFGPKDEVAKNLDPWGTLSYLNWKNFSTDFLKNLDKVNMGDDFVNKLALSALLKQWIDFGVFKSEVQSAKTPTDLASSLLSFYKKYTSSISLGYNPVFINEHSLDNWNKWAWFTEKNEKIVIDDMFIKQKELWGYENQDLLINKEKNKNFKPVLNKDTNMAEIDFYSKDIKNTSLNDFDKEPITLENLNQALIMWYTATFQNRLGAIVLETTYSRAPYFVQQYIKEAYEKDKDYNILFNVIPYDPKMEEIGTYLNVEFNNRNEILENAKIFGINENTQTFDLKSTTGKKLNKLLFERNGFDEIIPIVINKTMATKTGYKKGDTIKLDVIKQEIFQNESLLTLEDFSNNSEMKPYDEYRTQASRTYYSTTGKSFVDNKLPIFSNVNPVKYGEYEISAKNAYGSTKTTPIHKSVLKGDTYLTNTLNNHGFKIVGIQNGYGKSQAWISNEHANKIMDYDSVEKWTFENYFLKEWAHLKELSFVIDNPEILNFLETQPSYEMFLEKIEKSSKENLQSWTKVKQLFENLYPIFNYKNSPNPEFLDLTYGFSTSQKYGDYGVRGMNGTFEEQDGQIKEFVEGFGMGSLSTMMPLAQTRQILSQITQIVNVVMIVFMVIALVVSMTIILLTTGLVIAENKEFIATMKIIGYSNQYIVRQILGMYVIPMIVMFIVGTLVGWFVFSWSIDLLALSTSWVLPVIFAWWIPVAVFAIVFGVYVISFIAGWSNVQKLNPLVALKVND